MHDSEGDSIHWLEEDPFPHLKTRDLLLAVCQGVVGGKPTLDIAVENLGLSDEEVRLAQSCIRDTDRKDAEIASVIPNPHYAYYWAQVSMLLSEHVLEGKLGGSFPDPGSQEWSEQAFLNSPATLNPSTKKEATSFVTANDFEGFFDYLEAYCQRLFPTFDQTMMNLKEALDDVSRARADASRVLKRIDDYLNG